MDKRNPPYEIKTDGKSYWLIDKNGERCSRQTESERYIKAVKRAYESNDESDTFYGDKKK